MDIVFQLATESAYVVGKKIRYYNDRPWMNICTERALYWSVRESRQFRVMEMKIQLYETAASKTRFIFIFP